MSHDVTACCLVVWKAIWCLWSFSSASVWESQVRSSSCVEHRTSIHGTIHPTNINHSIIWRSHVTNGQCPLDILAVCVSCCFWYKLIGEKSIDRDKYQWQVSISRWYSRAQGYTHHWSVRHVSFLMTISGGNHHGLKVVKAGLSKRIRFRTESFGHTAG